MNPERGREEHAHLATAPGSDVTEDPPVGEGVSMTFDEAGEYYYECSIHPQQMRGKIVVN